MPQLQYEDVDGADLVLELDLVHGVLHRVLGSYIQMDGVDVVGGHRSRGGF